MSNLADYIMVFLVFNVFLVIIVLAVVMFINANVNKQQKEISFMFTRLQRAKKIEDIRTEDYDLLIIPGGVKAMEKVRQNKEMINFITNFHNQKKIIGCICSGAQMLISAKVVKGKKISGYYSMKDDIINAGAEYTDLPAVIDSGIITTAHYKDMGPWMKAILEVYYKELK